MEQKELEKLTVYDLKQRLSELKLPTTGNKHELIDRLLNENKKKKQRVNESDAGLFNNIPDTWIHQVLIYVRATDLGHLAKTCTRFNKIVNDPDVWEAQKQKYLQMCINYLQKRGPQNSFYTHLPENDKNASRWRNVFDCCKFEEFLFFLDKDLSFVHKTYPTYRKSTQIPITKLLVSYSAAGEELCDFLLRAGVEASRGELGKLLNIDPWEPIHEEWYQILVSNPTSLVRHHDTNQDPLVIAASKRDLKIVKDLVTKHKMDVNHVTWGRGSGGDVTALVAAAIAGKVDTVKFLIENGAKSDDEKFLSVCKKNPTNAVQIIAAMHEAPGSFNVNAVDDHNRTALMFACKEGNKELVEWLLAHKANPNHQCGYGANSNAGDRAILLAVNSSSPDKVAIVTALLKNGADPNVRDDYTDETPLSSTEDDAVKKVLEQHGAKDVEPPWKHVSVEP